MIQQEEADRFAQEWIKAWNKHDLSAILSHYAEEIEFCSPFISLLHFNEAGRVKGKAELERYFQVGLHAYPDLHFQLHQVLTGVSTLVLYYTSVKGKRAAEVMELTESGKVLRVVCHYASE